MLALKFDILRQLPEQFKTFQIISEATTILWRLGFAFLTEVSGADAGVDLVARRQDRYEGEAVCRRLVQVNVTAHIGKGGTKLVQYRRDVALMVVNQAPSVRAMRKRSG